MQKLKKNNNNNNDDRVILDGTCVLLYTAKRPTLLESKEVREREKNKQGEGV